MKKQGITLLLAGVLLVLSIGSLFVGVIDLDMAAVLSGDGQQLEVFLVSRLPRLMAILCTGAGMSTA